MAFKRTAKTSGVMNNNEIQQVLAHVKSLGQGKDTVLAHINPREVNILKQYGGKGNINSKTGLLQFDDGGDGGSGDSGGAGSSAGAAADAAGSSGNSGTAGVAGIAGIGSN